MKTVTLTEQYPSDFKPTMSVKEVQMHFEAFGLYDARMIGGSKTGYTQDHSDDLIVFNANVLMAGRGKVWYGDLNLTKDYVMLKGIAETLNANLYVLWESDGRFGEENKPFDELVKKAVWNTAEGKPTKEWYKNKMDKRYNNG